MYYLQQWLELFSEETVLYAVETQRKLQLVARPLDVRLTAEQASMSWTNSDLIIERLLGHYAVLAH